MKAWTQLLEPGPAIATICLVLAISSQTYAAPTLPDEHAEQSTEIEYYPVADATGCYYNFQHYDEGDRIITNEPCLNCTCHNRMLMCYLRVCPFTKAIGANCKVEKRSDQCCPVITCPEVPVQLITSTAPSTALGHLNEYGCSIDNLFYSDGARVPSNPENPCELCYCIRNKTACVMQECTLNVDGCTPVFQEGVCCPVRYNCDHPDYLEGPTTPQITTTTTTTTVAPTTTFPSVTCFFNGQSYNDGELVKKDIPCEKCYCLKGDILCAVQECGPTPLDKVNCTSLPIQKGQCCPDTYDCGGIIEEELTTLSSSYEPEPTTVSTVELVVTQGPLTTASHVEDEERTKLEGLPEGTTAAVSEEVTTESQEPGDIQHLVEKGDEITEKETQAPEVIEQITRQSVEGPKSDDQATERASEQTTRPTLEETSAQDTPATEKLETEQVTRVGVETETTEREHVTFVPAISPEDSTKAQEASETPSVEEETVKPSLEEQTVKPTESPIESVTSRVTEAIESVTSRFTEVVEAITKAIIGSSSEVPVTEIPEDKEATDEPTVEGITKDIIGSSSEGPATEVPEDKEITEQPTVEPVTKDIIVSSSEVPATEITEDKDVTEQPTIDAVTKAIAEPTSEVPATKIPEDNEVTEQPTESQEPGKEGVTEETKKSEKEAEVPEEEGVTKIIAVTEEAEPAFPTHPFSTRQPEIESDKIGVTPADSEKEKPEETSEHIEEEIPSVTKSSIIEKEQPELIGTTEAIKESGNESIPLTEEQPTTLSTEKEQQDKELVVHDGHEGIEEGQTKLPISETERPTATEEVTKPQQPHEDFTEAEQSATERTIASEVSTQTEPVKNAAESETESVEAAAVTEKEPLSEAPGKEQGKIEEPEVSTEPSEDIHTEATIEIKPSKDQVPVTEEPIVPQDCTEQGCVKIPAERPHPTEQPIEQGISPQPTREEQTSVPQAATEQPASEQTTSYAEQKADKTYKEAEQPDNTDVTELSTKSTTEKEEVVIVTEIPTKKTELPESMDHVSETAYPTETPDEAKGSTEEGKTSTESEIKEVELEPTTAAPEISKEPGDKSTEQPEYPEKEAEAPVKEGETQRPEVLSATEQIQPGQYYTSEAPSEGQTKQAQETQTPEGTTIKGQTKEPSSSTEVTEPALEEQTEQTLDERKPTETPAKSETSTTEISKKDEGKGEPEEAVTKSIETEPVEHTEVPSAEAPQRTTELPREEENEIEHVEPGTIPKTEETSSEEGETKAPQEEITTEISEKDASDKEVTTQKKLETEEDITEKAIIPEVCTSESECVPGAVPAVSEGETESTKVSEEPSTPSTSAKPEPEPTKAAGTTESNKIPETEEHTEETNEIPEGATEKVSKVTSVPEGVLSHTEESSGETPEVPFKDEEGSGQEPEEGSGSTSASPEETEVTESIAKVTKAPEEQPDVTTVSQEEKKEAEATSESEEPATPQPQEIPTEKGQLSEQSGTEPIPEIKPTEYPESTEYPAATELPEREIPGEGSCLVDGQTYKNNSGVPPINHCQSSCKCESSILKCESIECTPPPAGMQNCMPIFTSPDSCCPTYSCTGPETTSLMESDSHVIQTTTPSAEEPATAKAEQAEKTDRPEIVATTIATEENEPEVSEKATEIEKGAVTEGAATEKVTISTTHAEEPTQPQEETTEVPKESTEKASSELTESSPLTTSPGEHATGKPDRVTEAELFDKDHTTTVEPVVKIKPVEETAKPEEVTQVLTEVEGEQPTEATEKSKETEPTGVITEEPEQELETVKPIFEQPEIVTKKYAEELPTEIAPTSSTEGKDKIKPNEPTEVATTEVYKEPESTQRAGIPEIGTEIESEITEEPEAVTKETKKSELPEGSVTQQPEEEKEPIETSITEKPLAAITTEPIKGTREPVITEVESSTSREQPEKPSETTSQPEKEFTREVTTEYEKATKPSDKIEGETKTEQSKTVESEGETEKTPEQVEAQTEKITDQVEGATEKIPDQVESETDKTSKQGEDKAEKTPGQVEGQTEKTLDQVEDETEKTPGQVEGQTEKTLDQAKGETEKTPGQVEGETEKTLDQVEDETEKTPSQVEGETEKSPGQVEGETDKTPEQDEDKTEKTPGHVEGQTEKTLDQVEGEMEKTPDQVEGETEKTSYQAEGETEKIPDKVEGETEKEPKVTERTEIQEHGTTEVPSLPSELPESFATELPEVFKPLTTQPTVIVTEGESLDTTTKVSDKEDFVTQKIAEASVTEQEESQKESEVKEAQTTVMPKEEEPPVQHITMPPESESTGKPIESDSHVTIQQFIETSTPKSVEEKSTEKIAEAPLSEAPVDKPEEEGNITTGVPTDVIRPLEEAGKPQADEVTSKPILPEEHIPTTSESGEEVKVSAPETAVTESLPEEGSKKPTEEEKVTIEERKETSAVTDKMPVELSGTEQSSTSPSKFETHEVSPKATTVPSIAITASPQTEQGSEKTSEEITELPISATERTSAETSITEKIKEEPSETEKILKESDQETEIPLIFETEKTTESEDHSVTEETSGTPYKIEKIQESATLKPAVITEEPSTQDNEIPGVAPEIETTSVAEQEPESTEGPKKETDKPEIGLTRLPEEGQMQTTKAEEATTLSSIEKASSVVTEGQQPSKEGVTLETETESITGETEKLSVTEEVKTSIPEESATEGKPPQTEKETPVSETEKSNISEEVSTTEQPRAGETPSVSEEQDKTETTEYPIAVQTEHPRISAQPTSQETEKPLSEEETTSGSQLPIHETEKPGKPEEGTTQETEKASTIEEEGKTDLPEQPAGETTKPSIAEEGKTPTPEQPTIETEKPSIFEEETKTPTPEHPIIISEEEAITRQPVESSPIFPTSEITTPIAEEKDNASVSDHGELFTSGPKVVEASTKPHVPGELSTSAPVSEPTTILPATTSTDTTTTPAHIPGEHVPELPDYEQPGDEYDDDEQNAFGPGTCRYGGKVYVSAQQIPRDDPCDFCFCFRSDIICLQQSCPPPIPRCHEEPIRGFCCPRYECPVSMATSVNVTTSTTTTTTTLPPHFLSHAYKGRASKTGCQISGKAYKVGEAIKATSGPCLHCTCGGDGQMKCDPKPCSPEPMLRQMIAAAASRRRR